MTQINLLPWREELRAELKKQFILILIVALAIGVGIVYAVETRVQAQITVQKKRISFIQAETKILEKAIEEIKELQKKREQLISRMEVIQDLQGNRSIIVHHFDDLVRTLPDGVYFTQMNKKGKKFNIEGIAETNNRVSNLMRELTASSWFTKPNLAEVKATDEEVEASSSQFVLSVLESKPKKKKKGGDS